MTDQPASPPELETELDALYRAPLPEFVERRDALAKRLKLAGSDDAFRRVKALRKPSVVAWAINRLHLEQGGLAPLEAASSGLRGALRDPRSADERRSAIDARRRALESVTSAVLALIEESGTAAAPALLRRVERTLLALAADSGGPDAPVPGRLDQELEPPGFEALLDQPAPTASSTPATRAADVKGRAAPAKGGVPPKSAPPKGAVGAKGVVAAKTAGGAKSAPASTSTAAGKSLSAAKGATAGNQDASAKKAPASAGRDYVPTRDRHREAALAVAQRAVDDTEAELERATDKAEAARARVDDAEKVLDKARREVEAARRELVATRTRLSERRRELDRVRGGRPAG